MRPMHMERFDHVSNYCINILANILNKIRISRQSGKEVRLARKNQLSRTAKIADSLCSTRFFRYQYKLFKVNIWFLLPKTLRGTPKKHEIHVKDRMTFGAEASRKKAARTCTKRCIIRLERCYHKKWSYIN